MRIFKGNPVSKGIAAANAYIYKAFSCDVHEAYFEPGDEPKYLERFLSAKEKADAELTAIISSFSKEHADKAKIFTAHREILADEEIENAVVDAIRSKRYVTEYAVAQAFNKYIQILSRAKNPLIAARTADLRDVRNRILRILLGAPDCNLSCLPGPVIVVAHDLLPSDTATLDRDNVLGIVTEVGGATSHSAILAKSYRIPALLGVSEAMDIVKNGDLLILDALEGNLRINPDQQTVALFEKKRADYLAESAETEKFLTREPRLADGERIEIGLNIGSAKPDACYQICDFIGLFRTEFLYMGSDHLPTENEQFEAYKQVLLMAGERPVTLRTLDIGGDKTLKYMELPKEDNPFLGNRALRLCLSNPSLFKTQLRAALRASVYGKLQMMFPMVGSIDDIRAAKAMVEEAKEELREQRVPFDASIKLGIMIEIPSIAAIADLAVQEIDFASIGTNDLCQYLSATDRMNARIGSYYQSFSPAMFRVLKQIIGHFNEAGKPISVCGELAGNPLAAEILVGMGLRKFSMSGSAIAGVKRSLSRVTLQRAQETVRHCCMLATEGEIMAYLRRSANE